MHPSGSESDEQDNTLSMSHGKGDKMILGIGILHWLSYTMTSLIFYSACHAKERENPTGSGSGGARGLTGRRQRD